MTRGGRDGRLSAFVGLDSPAGVSNLDCMTQEERIKKIEEFCETESERTPEEWEAFMTEMEESSNA